MSDVEIYDPGAIGSDLHEDSMFHNPEVVADSIGEVKVKKVSKKKVKKESKKKAEPVAEWVEEANESDDILKELLNLGGKI